MRVLALRSSITRAFREAIAQLPAALQKQARKMFVVPSYPGLSFKKLQGLADLRAVLVGVHDRAPGRVCGEEIVWYSIGSHANYDHLVWPD